MRKILGTYSGSRPHWVGDGFPVRTIFSQDGLGRHISPFLMLDYAAPTRFDAGRPSTRCRPAPASGIRDRHHRVRWRARASRLHGRRRPHRPGRRAVDDRRVGHHPRGIPFGQVRARRGRPRDGAALGEPARQGQERARRLSDPSQSGHSLRGVAGRCGAGPHHRGHVRRPVRTRTDVLADGRLGRAASRGGDDDARSAGGPSAALIVLRGAVRLDGAETLGDGQLVLLDRGNGGIASPRMPMRRSWC